MNYDIVHRYYIFDPNVVDEKKVREEATKYREEGKGVEIHYHKHGDWCNERCESERRVNVR